jgi:ABC-type transport system involved in cytochrome c biogenesis permease component
LQAILGSGMVEGMDFLLFLGTPAVIILTAIGAAIGVRLDRWITSVREY